MMPLRLVSKLIGLLLFFLAVSPSSLVSAEFSQPTGLVGDANCFGEFQFTSHLGAVELSRKEKYDFHYIYSSEPGRYSPHLGRGYFVPMLEAVLIDRDYFLEATTMGGNTIYMYQLPAEPDRYVSLNGKNRAHKLGEGIFRRTTAEGFQFEYRLGRLERAVTPEKTILTFHYDGDFCREIRSSTGATVCTLARPSEYILTFTSASGRYQLKLIDFSVDAEEAATDDSYPTLGEINWPGGEKTVFDYSESDEDVIRLRMRYEEQEMLAEWRRLTGRIVKVDEVQYAVAPLRREIDYQAERSETGVYTIRRVFPDESWISFLHDEDAGYSETTWSDGRAMRTHFINTRGPVFNLIRKRERLEPGSGEAAWKTYYEAFYDAAGDLLREVNEGKITWHLQPGGLSASIVKDDDNFFRYDNESRVIQSRVNGNKTHIRWMRDDVRRVVSEYEWGEVHLAWFDSYGNPLELPENESFPESRDLR